MSAAAEASSRRMSLNRRIVHDVTKRAARIPVVFH
jgi:hypothetical protein